ncbi:MAG: agmatine deiminase family protein [Candidatus Omnitrophica bacterium]|nr:agmatine deiminase family protein [Candidatus Omnitrophota bacterium]
MENRCLSLFVISLTFAVLAFPVQAGEKFWYPAEWEPHDSVWIGFRTFEDGPRYEPLLEEMVRVLAKHVPVKVVIEDEQLLPAGQAHFLKSGADPGRIEIFVEKFADFWFRDPGPLFLTSDRQGLAIANFSYSNYANVPPELFTPDAIKYGNIDTDIAQRLGLPLVESNIVLEGGAFEVNGRGTVLLAASTLRRNPGLDRVEIESEVLRTLGQKKVIWLNEGLAEDPLGFSRISGKYWGRGAGGHTDEFVRFVNANTVLLAWVPEDARDENPVYKINYHRMSENYELLRAATDQDGNALTIIKVPVPSLIMERYVIQSEEAGFFQKTDPELLAGAEIYVVAAASYLNYVVSNGIVLLPQYADAHSAGEQIDKDAKVRGVIEKYFPERQIVPMNPSALNYHGGGMHCIVVQQSSRK